MRRQRSEEPFGFTPAGHVEAWSRWRPCETLAKIGRVFVKHVSSVLHLVR